MTDTKELEYRKFDKLTNARVFKVITQQSRATWTVSGSSQSS